MARIRSLATLAALMAAMKASVSSAEEKLFFSMPSSACAKVREVRSVMVLVFADTESFRGNAEH